MCTDVSLRGEYLPEHRSVVRHSGFGVSAWYLLGSDAAWVSQELQY